MIFAIINMFANSAESILDKVILKTKNITYKQFLPFSMAILFIIGLFVFPFLGRVDIEFFTTKYLLLFILETFVAYFYNVFFFYSLKKEELCDVEPFVLLDRPVTVIMAALLFPSERSLWPLVLTLIAAFALILSRLKRKHFKIGFKKTTLALVGFIFLLSLEAQLAKVLLEVMSPVGFYLFRTGLLTVIFWIVFRPKISKLPSFEKRNILATGLITYIEYIARFYAIIYLGIVQSTLILLLSPLLTLTFSKVYLKEHFTFRKAMADFIILGCVVATLLMR